MLEESIYYNSLYDYYSNLLTEKQRLYYEEYYFNNLTLKEISENYKISRNAIHKNIKDTISKLEEYEEKLGLKNKSDNIKKAIKDEKIIKKIEKWI